MVSASALLRVVLLLVAAATLAGLVQHYWTHDGGLPETPPVAAPPAATSPARRPEPATVPSPPPAPVPMPARTPEAPSASTSETVATNAQPAPSATPQPPSAPVEPQLPPAAPQARVQEAPAPATPSSGQQDANAATGEPPAVDLVDLNTASLAELNGLRGGGAIGRAIIQHRPYASVDQLLSKRVLTRGIYQKVKDQVTVR